MPSMKPYLPYAAGALLCALLLGAGILYAQSQRAQDGALDWRDRSEAAIVLTETGFEPQQVRVRAGTKVTFTTTRDKAFWPASNPHPSHTLYNAFDPREPVAPEGAWSFVPQEPGTWGFHDHIRSYYTGVLYVE